MSKRLNIGVYIGPDDLDIAAWFNLLKENKISRAKWVKGLLAAYAINKPLDIGSVSAASISACEALPVKDNHTHGWQVKGINGEYIGGSVVNVSIGKAEIVGILEEAWANNHHLSTFIKALIHKNLKVSDKEVLPEPENYKRIYSEFLIKENKKMLGTKNSASKSATKTGEKQEVANSPKAADKKAVPAANTEPIPAKSSTPAFNFGSKQETRTKNPLSDLYI